MTNAAPTSTPLPIHDAEAETDSISIARQVIVDDKGKVFGYELFDRTRRSDAHDASSDAQMLLNVLSQSGTTTQTGKYTIFVNCAPESLSSEHLELVKPELFVLQMPPVAGNAPAAIEDAAKALTRLHAQGFKLSFNHSVLTTAYQQWLPLASFIKIDLLTLKADLVDHIIRLAQKRKPDAPVIVEKIETAEQHTQVAAQGVRLFQGFWFAKPVVVTSRTIRPAHAVIIQLIDALRKHADTDQIEAILKRDATLSFNLLRYINSSGFGLGTEITSFRHAVMMLGLQKLFRWAALLLTMSRAGGAPPVVGQMAIVRGRLMELLAAELLPADECDNAFVAGVFSLLDTMLGVPMDKALGAISLPETITDALLHRNGPLAPFLELTIACETADDASFARSANALALNNHQVNWAHLQALAWAETIGE